MKLRIVTLHKYTADDIISVLTSNVPYPIFVVLTCFMQCIKVIIKEQLYINRLGR